MILKIRLVSNHPNYSNHLSYFLLLLMEGSLRKPENAYKTLLLKKLGYFTPTKKLTWHDNGKSPTIWRCSNQKWVIFHWRVRKLWRVMFHLNWCRISSMKFVDVSHFGPPNCTWKWWPWRLRLRVANIGLREVCWKCHVNGWICKNIWVALPK